MTGPRVGVEADVVAWLIETGVADANMATRISSLNLAWIVHRYEETYAVAVEFTDEELARIVDVQTLVELLTSTKGQVS